MYWFIMSPYKSPPLGGCIYHLLSLRCICPYIDPGSVMLHAAKCDDSFVMREGFLPGCQASPHHQEYHVLRIQICPKNRGLPLESYDPGIGLTREKSGFFGNPFLRTYLDPSGNTIKVTFHFPVPKNLGGHF